MLLYSGLTDAFLKEENMGQHETAFNVDIADDLANKFSTLAEKLAMHKYRVIEGAVKAFLVLPADIQVAIITADEETDIHTILVEGLLETEILTELDRLGPAKEKFLALLRQAIDSGDLKK